MYMAIFRHNALDEKKIANSLVYSRRRQTIVAGMQVQKKLFTVSLGRR
jgi:hypothetical protein